MIFNNLLTTNENFIIYWFLATYYVYKYITIATVFIYICILYL